MSEKESEGSLEESEEEQGWIEFDDLGGVDETENDFIGHERNLPDKATALDFLKKKNIVLGSDCSTSQPRKIDSFDV